MKSRNIIPCPHCNGTGRVGKGPDDSHQARTIENVSDSRRQDTILGSQGLVADTPLRVTIENLGPLAPANQRRAARLIARLINLGVTIHLTTQSDYIVKELNTLIMLKSKRQAKLRQHHGYAPEELLSAKHVRAYVVETSGRSRKTVPCSVTPDYGIEAKCFDRDIIEQNHIQESIVLCRDR